MSTCLFPSSSRKLLVSHQNPAHSPLSLDSRFGFPDPRPSLHPSLDHTGLCVHVHHHLPHRDSRGGGSLPGWGVDGRRGSPLAIFLTSLDVLHLPAHGVPLHREVIHPQVLVGCGRIQAEHERWGRVDGGVTEMGKPQETQRERQRQTVTKTDHDGQRTERDKETETKTKRGQQTKAQRRTDRRQAERHRKRRVGEEWRGRTTQPEE